ncbi:hypothetical protein [Primorskyibacter sedentarius]|uniref:hypothetical protein n=1 Tax=Primorskyibacter sedentarius TaxID=745311 RepID=UPI00104A44E8|nr:hypothetical protein [Primorskyibacter sedentarius]
MTKIGGITVEFKFASLIGLVIPNLSYGFGHYPVKYPGLYLSQFHADHMPDGMLALIDVKPAVNEWVSLI